MSSSAASISSAAHDAAFQSVFAACTAEGLGGELRFVDSFFSFLRRQTKLLQAPTAIEQVQQIALKHVELAKKEAKAAANAAAKAKADVAAKEKQAAAAAASASSASAAPSTSAASAPSGPTTELPDAPEGQDEEDKLPGQLHCTSLGAATAAVVFCVCCCAATAA